MHPRYDMTQCFVVRFGKTNSDPCAAEFLQLLRATGDYMGDTWQIVAGRIEPGERADQAALRELHEETSLRPIEFYRLSGINSFYFVSDDAVFHCPVFCAVVAVDAEVKLNAEHSAYRWVHRDRIEPAIMWAAERAFAADICREILDAGPAKEYLRFGV